MQQKRIRNKYFEFLKPASIVLILTVVFLNVFSIKTAGAENMLNVPPLFKTNSFFAEIKSLNSLKKILQLAPDKKLSNVTLSENTKKTMKKQKNKKLSARPKKSKKRKMVKNTKSSTKEKTAKVDKSTDKTSKRKLANIASSCSDSFENEFTMGYVQVGYNCDNLKEALCTDETNQINCPEIHCVSTYDIQRNSCKDSELTQYYCDPKKEKLISSRPIECPEGCDPSGFFCAPPKE